MMFWIFKFHIVDVHLNARNIRLSCSGRDVECCRRLCGACAFFRHGDYYTADNLPTAGIRDDYFGPGIPPTVRLLLFLVELIVGFEQIPKVNAQCNVYCFFVNYTLTTPLVRLA